MNKFMPVSTQGDCCSNPGCVIKVVLDHRVKAVRDAPRQNGDQTPNASDVDHIAWEEVPYKKRSRQKSPVILQAIKSAFGSSSGLGEVGPERYCPSSRSPQKDPPILMSRIDEFASLEPGRAWLNENIQKFQDAYRETDWQLLTDIFNEVFETKVQVDRLMVFWNVCVWEQSGRRLDLSTCDAGFVDVQGYLSKRRKERSLGVDRF